jgi:branched-chain amino acid transport system substrate-binding protein
MVRSRWKQVAAVGAAAVLLASACSSSRDDTSTGNNNTTDGTGGGGGASGFTIDTSSCSNYQPTQGITDTEIKIGSSLPLSGLYGTAFSAIEKGYSAWFDHLNADLGGVKGRKVTVTALDDAYNAGQTKTNVDKLVQQDGVFALFNVVGTASVAGVRDDLGEQCVPLLYAATGSALWGQTEDYPWVIGSIPAYPTEAAVFVDYLKKDKPDAKVGILAQNDDLGTGYSEAFKDQIEDTNITVVKEETYNADAPDVTSQITSLQAAGADTVLLASTALACPNATKAIKGISGWNPTTYISATCAAKLLVDLAEGSYDGVLTTQYVQDPADPKYADTEGMKDFKELGKKYGLSDEDLTNGLVTYGWAMGQLLTKTLEQAPELTRKSVMETAYNLDKVDLPVLMPEVYATTNGAEDPFVIETLYLARHDGSNFVVQGDAVSFEGRTVDYVPTK